jgi:hypothetical protein
VARTASRSSRAWSSAAAHARASRSPIARSAALSDRLTAERSSTEVDEISPGTERARGMGSRAGRVGEIDGQILADLDD